MDGGSSLVAQASHCSSSLIVAHRLSCPAACGIFQNRDWTCVPCISMWILNHWTTREAQLCGLKQHRCILWQLWDQQSKTGLWAQSQGVSSTGSSWRFFQGDCPLPFPVSRGCWRSLAYSYISPSSTSIIAWPLLWPSCIPLIRTLVITLGPPRKPRTVFPISRFWI